MTRPRSTRSRLCISGCFALTLIGAVLWARMLFGAPERIFRSLAAARQIEGIEVTGFRSDIGKDSSYRWRLGHADEAVPLILASLPFHPCDEADSDMLRRMFASEFQIPPQSLVSYTGYRGDNARHDAEYLLVAPDRRESFYYYIDF